MAHYHTPCMPNEVAHYLNCRPGQTIVDGTVGGGRPFPHDLLPNRP